MIPKKIHYCWFGGNSKSKLIEKCIKSWKKYCPDYEIIEWNESNFDLNCCDYVREAYEAKKWAFVSDYVRIWALNTYGGIYLDTDVEITQNLDKFLPHSAFTGFESKDYPFTAVFGCEKNHHTTETILESYSNRVFKLGENEYDLQPNTAFITNIFIEEYGVKLNNETQHLKNGLTIYSNDYFCPCSCVDLTFNKTKNTHAIHWFNASWHESKYPTIRKKLLAEKRAKSFDKLIHLPNRILLSLFGEKNYKKIKSFLRK